MNAADRWEEFRVFSGRGAAEALVSQLELNQVPAKIETRALEGCVEMKFCVLVGSHLAHRARRIVAQLPPTEDELNFLATGKLPGQE